MKGEKLIYLLALIFLLGGAACASKPKTSTLLREIPQIPPLIEKIIVQEGEVDYFLLHDEGYSWRLIFLCANKVYNLVVDAENRPILVSFHPLIGSDVEEKIPPWTAIKYGNVGRKKYERNRLR